MNAIAPIPMKYRLHDMSFPRGWYRVAGSAEISGEAMLPVSYLDRQLIVYRTEDGSAQVADAYCPHLGAHLASHDGSIKEGRLTCPFHKWTFDGATGQCVDIPYSKTMVPKSVKLTLYPTVESEGSVLMWYDKDGRAPDFQPFDTGLLRGDHKWHHYATRRWEMTVPFRDLLENLFDTGHIKMLHNSSDLPEVTSFEQKDHGLFVTYDLNNNNNDFPLEEMVCAFNGISGLNQLFRGDMLSTLMIHSMTPIDHERMVQTTELFIREMPDPNLYDMIGKPWLERFCMEVEQDIEVLNYKKHLSEPRLCAGDGPIMKYRQYAESFFS